MTSKIRVLDLYEIKGKSNALNEMIKHCSFNYVAILDVDDIWHEQKLELQAQMLNKFDVIGSNCVWFGDRPGIVPYIPVGDISNYDFSSVNPIINSSSVIRKELCHWNSKCDGVEDYDLWLKLRNQNKRFFNFKEILVKHRIHNASAFNSKGNNDKVDNLLLSHGHKSHSQKIAPPQVNKMLMKF
jgi:glycosyltransferase involved in cell wall biosynthesis